MAVSHLLIGLWNSLPEPARHHDDLTNFKTAMKTYLFHEQFS